VPALPHPEFTAFAKTLQRFRQLIWNTLDHSVSNGRAEGINTRLAALTARARASTAQKHSSPWPNSPVAAYARICPDDNQIR
jgi:Transposase